MRKEEPEVKTNLDRIKQMNASEMADVLNSMLDYCPAATDGRVYCDKTDCKPCIVKWLESEAVDES